MKRSNFTLALAAVTLLAAAQAVADPRPEVQHVAPTKALSGEPILLEAEISNWEQFEKLLVRYREPGDEWHEVALVVQYGDLFRAELPAEAANPPGIEYYLEAVLYSGKRQPLLESARRPLRLAISGAKVAKRAKPAEPDAAFDDAPPPKTEARPAEKAPASTLEMPPPPLAKGRALQEREQTDEAPAPPKPAAPEVRSSPAAEPEPEIKFPPMREPKRHAIAPAPRPRSELDDELLASAAEDPLALALRDAAAQAREPGFVATFTNAELRKLGVRQVYEVLDLVPGLSTSRDVQGFFRLGVRGVRSDPEVLFLLDGHPLNNFFDGRALSTLPIENLERIEIHRGPGGAQFGGNAFLAVVNLVSVKGPGVRAAVGGGSFGTYDGHLAGGGALGALQLSGDAELLKQDGFSKAIAADALARDTLDQALRTSSEPSGKTNDARTFVSAGARAAYEAANLGTVSLSGRVLYEDRAALVGLFDAVGRDSKLGWLTVLADAGFERPITPEVRFFAKLGFDQQSTDRTFQLSPDGFRTGPSAESVFPDGLLERTRIGVRTIGLDVGAAGRLGSSNQFTAAVRVERQDLTDYVYETNYSADDQYLGAFQRPVGLVYPQEKGGGAATSRLRFALWGEDRLTLLERLTLDLGLRLEAVQLPDATSTREIQGTRWVPSLNPRVGLAFAVSEPLVLKVQYERAFRAPTVQELAETIPDTNFNQGRFEGNPLLSPSALDQVEAGGEWTDASGGARVRLRLHGFFQSFSRPIATVDTSGNIVPVANRDGVRVAGIEGSARADFSSRTVAWANASFFRAEDLGNSVPSLITDTPQARFNAGFTLPIGPWLNLDTQLRFGVERKNDIRTVLEQIRRYSIPSFSVFTAQLRTEPILDHFEVAALAQNVFDQALLDDVPRPDRITGLLPREGRSLFLTVRAFY